MEINHVRPKVAKLTARLLYPLVDEGIISNAEYSKVCQNIRSLTKDEALAPAVSPKLLNQAEVSEMLGIGLSNFKRLEAEGEIKIPRRMVGKSVRYKNMDVLAYMDGNDFKKEL